MRIIIITIITVSSFVTGFSQSKISGKIDLSYILFGTRIINVENQNFKDYSLDSGQNGVNLNLISGIKFNDKVFLGVGLGYMNFDLDYSGIHGFSSFSALEFTPTSHKKFNFYLHSKLGYNQLFSQFQDNTRKETGTLLAEFNVGLKYPLSSKIEIYILSGILLIQQSAFLPIRIGLGL